MLVKKQRPLNGPGSNGLRGGTRIYTNGKTAVGGWLDHVGGPSGYRRGFTTLDFETETQKQQQDVLTRRPPYYGAPLPLQVNEKLPSAEDNFMKKNNEVNMFESTTREMMTYDGKEVDRLYHKPLSNLRGGELNKYRKTWTNDNIIGRNLRFQTESRRANSHVPSKFQVYSIRLLPGTPKAIENFRERLIEQYGLISFCVLRFKFKDYGNIISSHDLRKLIKGLAVTLSHVEFSQILAFFTANDDVEVENFIRTVIARIDGFDDNNAGALFDVISDREADGDYSIHVNIILERINQNDFRDIYEGFNQHISAYCNGNLITRDAFKHLLYEMYACDHLLFLQIMPKLFLV